MMMMMMMIIHPHQDTSNKTRGKTKGDKKKVQVPYGLIWPLVRQENTFPVFGLKLDNQSLLFI